MRLYLITRRDLTPAQQAIQVVHSFREFIREHPGEDLHWYEKSGAVAFLSVPDENALHELMEKAKALAIPCAGFLEPDLNDSLTSVTMGPQAQKLCRKLPLALPQ